MSPAWLGTFIGTMITAALKVCGPDLVKLYKMCTANTVEEGNAPKSVVDDINADLDSADRLRNKDGDRAPGRPDGGPQDHP